MTPQKWRFAQVRERHISITSKINNSCINEDIELILISKFSGSKVLYRKVLDISLAEI